MQTRRNSKIANGEVISPFRALGRRLALSPTPAGFAWAALMLCRAGGVGHTPKQLEGLVLYGGRDAINHGQPFSVTPSETCGGDIHPESDGNGT